jgi:hypothetical protein
MGTFDFSTPNHQVYAMSSRPVLTGRSIPFRTSYFDDPWTIPSPTLSYEGQSHAGMAMPLSTTEIAFQVVLDTSVDSNHVLSPTDEEDTSLSCSHDCLDDCLVEEDLVSRTKPSSKP